MAATHVAHGTDSGGSRRQGFDATLPKTILGRWSMWLAVAFVIGFVINMAIVGVMGTSTNPGWNEFSSTYLPYWGVGLFACGFAAGVVGLVAILKQAERSLITLLTLIPTAFVIMFLLGELLGPAH